MHTIKVVGYHPYDLKEGPHHWDNIKEEVADATLKYIQRYSPNLTNDKILERVTHSPLDLERMNPHNWHGSCHAGASGPSQTGNHAAHARLGELSNADCRAVSDRRDAPLPEDPSPASRDAMPRWSC